MPLPAGRRATPPRPPPGACSSGGEPSVWPACPRSLCRAVCTASPPAKTGFRRHRPCDDLPRHMPAPGARASAVWRPPTVVPPPASCKSQTVRSLPSHAKLLLLLQTPKNNLQKIIKKLAVPCEEHRLHSCYVDLIVQFFVFIVPAVVSPA